jgi:UDP-glucoronosyl and UDP-glucosyl transferase
MQGDVLTRMVEHKIAVGIDKFATEEEIYSAIIKVRDDISFRQSVKRMSSLLRNRRTSAMDEAVGLLHYVAETGGAEHLKVSSRYLNLVEYYCIDCILIILSLSVLFLFFLSRFFLLCRCIRHRGYFLLLLTKIRLLGLQ